MNTPFKAVSKRFNKSLLGQSLGVHGEKVQRLALHLLTNSYLNEAGSYWRPLSWMQAETGLSTRSLIARLKLLERLGFCTYDFDKERVSVPLLAQMHQRLLPKPEPGVVLSLPAEIHTLSNP